MTYTTFVLTALLVVVQTSVVKSPARLKGLDRLYFQNVGEPGAALDASPVVASLLPELLRESDFSRKPMSPEEYNVSDFRLPSGSWGRKLWLRQIVNFTHPRIFELWWALYDHERRSDVWYFISKREKALRKCGFQDPLIDPRHMLSWRELERVALCITQKPGAKRSSRAFNEPSFIERGGRPQ